MILYLEVVIDRMNKSSLEHKDNIISVSGKFGNHQESIDVYYKK
jgi:hypothetical protein